jgi:hypothetical protein
MPAAWIRVLGLVVISGWLLAGCGKGIDIHDSGGAAGGGTAGSVGPKLDAATPPDLPPPEPVTVIPVVLDLGSVELGQTSATPSSVTVTNLGPATSLAPQIVQPSPFSLAVNTCDPLPANGTCTIAVSFTPTVAGPAAGTLVVTGAVKVSLTGVGIPLADFTMPDKVDLGTVLVGASVSGKVTITAASPLSDLLCSVQSTGNVKADPSTTTCPATGILAQGASCFFGFTFSSATPGLTLGDEIICDAGNVTRFTRIIATVARPAKLVITPPNGQIVASIGTSNTITFTVANGGDVKTGTITAAITPSDPEFVVSGSTCTTGLFPVGTCTVTVTFTRTTYGTKTAVLVVTDSDAPADSVTATVTGPDELTSVLNIIGGPDLGTAALGETGTPVTFTVRNGGGTDAVGVVVSTNNPAFVIGHDTCTGQTLAKTTGSCTLTVTFAPAENGITGVYAGLLTASFTGGNPFNLPIIGTAVKPATDGGVGDSGGAGDGHPGDASGPKPDVAIPDGPASVRVAVNPTVLYFGSVDVGSTSSAPSSVTVTNLGPATSLTPQIVPVPSPFTLAGNTCNVLPANGTCTISVSFTPTVLGPAAGTLAVAGAVMVSLNGTGTPPANFTMTDRIDLGTVLVGASVPGQVTVTATNPLTDLLCSVQSAGNIKADPTTTTCTAALAKGATCYVGFTFSSATPGAKTGDEIICNAGSTTKFTSITAIVASPAKLLITPAAASTAATTGKSSTINFTVANGGDVRTGAITAAISPANPEFVVSGTTCAVGLLPLGICTVTVTFQPTVDGTKTATLVVTDSGAPAAPATATLTGVATPT